MRAILDPVRDLNLVEARISTGRRMRERQAGEIEKVGAMRVGIVLTRGHRHACDEAQSTQPLERHRSTGAGRPRVAQRFALHPDQLLAVMREPHPKVMKVVLELATNEPSTRAETDTAMINTFAVGKRLGYGLGLRHGMLGSSEHDTAPQGPAPGRGDRDLGITWDLTLSSLVPELYAGLV